VGRRTTGHALDAGTLDRVLGQYDLGGSWEAEGPGGGTANLNLVIRSPRGRFFLRRRNPRYSSPEQVAYEHALMRHLAAKGIGGPLPIETRGGETAFRDGAAVYELQRFVEGEPFDPTSMAQLRGAALALAEWHAAADDFAPPVPRELSRYDDPRAIREGFGSLLPRATPEQARGIERVLAIAARLGAEFPHAAYRALPHGIIHGDYHPANVLFRGSRLVGVFDLDWASRQPRVRDLSDGIYYFGARRPSAIDGGDIRSLNRGVPYDVPRARAFLDAYRERRPVTAEEIAALPAIGLARWLFARVAGMRKVSEAERVAFALSDLMQPVEWLERHGAELVNALQ